MEYKDAVGVDIQAGDYIVYSSSDGRLQLGHVVELSQTKTKWSGNVAYPTLKIRAARRSWSSDEFEKMKAISTLSKLENVLVLNNNLVAQITLM